MIWAILAIIYCLQAWMWWDLFQLTAKQRYQIEEMLKREHCRLVEEKAEAEAAVHESTHPQSINGLRLAEARQALAEFYAAHPDLE